jgi:hypothetical protein
MLISRKHIVPVVSSFSAMAPDALLPREFLEPLDVANVHRCSTLL